MKNQSPEAVCPGKGTGCDPDRSGKETQPLEHKVCALEAERVRLGQQVGESKAAQQHFLERSAGLEEQNATLATLYVACQRLHSSLNRADVLLTIREIITNLIGCEEYALLALTPDGLLRLVDSFGLERAEYEKLSPTAGVIGRVLQTGQTYPGSESHGRDGSHNETNIAACIPLERNGVATGVLALFRLLPQKSELLELDRELFRLLETHVATALYCADLHEEQTLRNGAAA